MTTKARLALAALIVSGSLLPGTPLGAQEKEEDVYHSDGRAIRVAVLLDRIGLIAYPTTSPGRVDVLARAFELEADPEHDAGLFSLKLAAPLPRRELAALAREVRAASGVLAREVGLVVEAPLGGPPAVLTDDLIVRFAPEVTREEQLALFRGQGLEVVERHPTVEGEWLLRYAGESPLRDPPRDALQMANLLFESAPTEFAHPDFWRGHVLLSTPNDPLFPVQWHHELTGPGGGIPDADLDSTNAWDYTTGDPRVVIAVIDDGVDYTHEDLEANALFVDGEYVGWDLVNGPADDWDPDPDTSLDFHGTAVAGLAVGRGNNGVGGAGTCPECGLVPLQLLTVNPSENDDEDEKEKDEWADYSSNWKTAQAFILSIALLGSDAVDRVVINCSWTTTDPNASIDKNVREAIEAAWDAGIPIFFGAGNQNSAGWCTGSYPSLDKVISVSSVTSWNAKAQNSANGACVDLLAPSYHADAGTLRIVTSDLTGDAGHNSKIATDFCLDSAVVLCVCDVAEELMDTNYTICFGGTSAAAPQAAGVAGLILSAQRNLTPLQVQRILQDTAEKVQPGAAEYSPLNGYSDKATPTHGYGRINAREAVRLASCVGAGARCGIDLFIRDNDLDWGNTASSHGHDTYIGAWMPTWESPDIKVDSLPFSAVPTTSAEFDALPHDSAWAGQMNRVYVRVRNRGWKSANPVGIRLFYSIQGGPVRAVIGDNGDPLPCTPSADGWKSLRCAGTGSCQCSGGTMGYSGASVAGTAEDSATIVRFDFEAPSLPADRWFAYLATVDSPDDPLESIFPAMLWSNPLNNNVAVLNKPPVVVFLPAGDPLPFEVVGGSEGAEMMFRAAAPEGWTVELEPFGFDEPFRLAPGETVTAMLRVTIPEPGEEGEVKIVQELVDPDPDEPAALGGVTYRFRRPEDAPRPNAVTFDCNGDSELDVSDAVCAIVYLFFARRSPACLDAIDYNGDGLRNIADPIAALSFLFQRGPAPPAGLGCAAYPGCVPQRACP